MFHQTNTLTTGIDPVTGTAGDDTISGARVDSVQTWNSGDKIDGGAGNDTLTAVISGPVAPATGGVVGVENLVVTATAASAITFANAAGTTVNISGVTSVTNLASAGVLTLTNLTAIPVITLNNASAGTVVTFATDVLAGTADTVTLNLSGVNPAAGVGGGINLAAGAAGIENLVINSTTAASSINALHFNVTTGTDGLGLGGANSSVKTLTVTGDADLTLAGSAFAKVTSFDGSTATGGITASFATFGSGTTNVQTITTGAGKDVVTLGQNGAQYTSINVNTGAGNDTVAVAATLSTKHTIDGGAGKDTLSIDTGAAAITVANVNLVNNQTSNFEVMSFANSVDVLDASSFTGFTDYVFTQASAASAGTTAITGLTSSNTLTFNDNLTGLGAVGNTASSNAALSLTATGSSQTANLVADSASTLAIAGGAGSAAITTVVGRAASEAITFGAGVTTLSITADSAITITGGAAGVTATAAGGAASAAIANGTTVTTVNITGDGAVTIAGGALAGSSSTLTAASTNGFTGAVTVNASTLEGVLTIQGSTGQDSITGGTGNDVIRGGASNDTIILTAGGKDTVVFEATAAGNAVDTISGFNVGSGKDLLNVNAFLGHANATVTGDVIKITNLSGSATIATETVIIVNFNAAIASKDFGSAAGFAELFGAAKALSTTLADAAEAVVVVQGTDGTQVYYVDNGTGSDTTLLATEVSLVANLVGVTNADTFDFSNFVI